MTVRLAVDEISRKDSPTLYQVRRAACAEQLNVFLTVLKEGGPVLSLSEQASAEAAGWQFVWTYHWLASEIMRAGSFQWKSARSSMHSFMFCKT